MENRFQLKIGTLYLDNGGEFVALREFLSNHGIYHFTTPTHTPEHNGISERKHRHIRDRTYSLASSICSEEVLALRFCYDRLFNQQNADCRSRQHLPICKAVLEVTKLLEALRFW